MGKIQTHHVWSAEEIEGLDMWPGDTVLVGEVGERYKVDPEGKLVLA